MANKSYLNFEDELNDQEPYSSVSSREPLSDVGFDSILNQDQEEEDDGDLPVSQPATLPRSEAIKQAILSRKAPAQSPSNLAADPLMKNFMDDKQAMGDLREAKRGADLISNLGQSFSQMAQGSNTPKSNQSLFDNLASQNQGMMKSAEGDLERKQKVIQAIEQRKSREAVSNNTAQYRQQMLDLQNKRLKQNGDLRSQADQTKQSRLDSLNIGRANSLMHDAPLNKETTKLNAANGVQTLIDSIKNGEITDSKNIRTQLTNMMAMIDLGAAGGESDRQSMGINNLYTKLKDMEAYVSSKPNSSIPSEYLNQLESEAHAMGDRSAKNYQAMSKAILSGADLSGGSPDVDPGQVHQLVKQRMSTFLKEKGYDPETGARVSKSGLTPQNEKSGVQTKVIHGRTYAKVPGGWQEVE